MDPGDADRDELAERVEQLEQTVSKMLPDRRGVLKGLGAAAVGGAAVSGATGGASGQSAAGQVGTRDAPVDIEGAQGNFDSVSTVTSLTDPAGVTHTGELADIDDVGGGTGGTVEWENVQADHGAAGDGNTDDSTAFQNAVDAAGPGGVVYVPPTSDSYQLADRVLINEPDVTVMMDNGASFSVSDGSWTLYQHDPAADIPEKKAMFILNADDCVVLGGSFDGNGFAHETGTDVCGILVHNADDCLILDGEVLNMYPSGAPDPRTGSPYDGSVPIRCQGILVTKTTGTTVKNCRVDNVQYDCISARIGIRDVTFENNRTSNGYEGIQHTYDYGTVDPADSGDKYADQILIASNLVHDCSAGYQEGAGIVSHGEHAIISENQIRDSPTAIALLQNDPNGSGCAVSGNIITNASKTTPDTVGVWLRATDGASVTDNIFATVEWAIRPENSVDNLTISGNNSRDVTSFYEPEGALSSEAVEYDVVGTDDWEIQKDGDDGAGVINFKTS